MFLQYTFIVYVFAKFSLNFENYRNRFHRLLFLKKIKTLTIINMQLLQ